MKKVILLLLVATSLLQLSCKQKTQVDIQREKIEKEIRDEKPIQQKQKSNKPILKRNTNQDIENLLSSWNGSLPSLVDLVKSNLHNPKSFKHVETGYINKGEYIEMRMIYGAENGYGALRTESITAKVDFNGKIIEIIQ